MAIILIIISQNAYFQKYIFEQIINFTHTRFYPNNLECYKVQPPSPLWLVYVCMNNYINILFINVCVCANSAYL